MIKIGLVGMPNVGKSSFFKLLTKLDVVIQNFCFSTIDPNIAIINYFDANLAKLQPIYSAQKIIYEKASLYDIAGLVKGASAGVGLGNNFLACIQEVDIICHIVKCFKDVKNINQNTFSVADNYEIINIELILHDLKVINNNFARVEKKTAMKKSQEQEVIVCAMKKAKTLLEKNIYLSSALTQFSIFEQLALKPFGLLSLKPCIVLANVSEEQLATFSHNSEWVKLKAIVQQNSMALHILPIRFLLDVAALASQQERDFFLADFTQYRASMDIAALLKHFFDKLGFSFFFTCGPREVRAWAFLRENATIKTVVGKIHSSFTMNFIMARVINYQTILAYPKLTVNECYAKYESCVNKTYNVQYGDIINVLLRN